MKKEPNSWDRTPANSFMRLLRSISIASRKIIPHERTGTDSPVPFDLDIVEAGDVGLPDDFGFQAGGCHLEHRFRLADCQGFGFEYREDVLKGVFRQWIGNDSFKAIPIHIDGTSS